MAARNKTTIELSKKKITLQIFLACGFVVLGAWLYSLDAETIQSMRRFNSPLLVHGIGLASMILFGFFGGFATWKLFDNKPGLELDNFGIMDNASGLAAGLIPWADVVDTGIYQVQKQKMLVVKVRDPQKYIIRGGPLKRLLVKANHKMCGSPIVISPNALKIDFDELVSLFDRHHEKYGKGYNSDRP